MRRTTIAVQGQPFCTTARRSTSRPKHNETCRQHLCSDSLGRDRRGLDTDRSSSSAIRRSVGRSGTRGSIRAALLAAGRDRLEDARQAGLPRLQPLLQELPLFPLERARGRARDVQRLRRLGELAGDEAGPDH